MKRYVPIIIGIVALLVLVWIGRTVINNNDVDTDEQEVTTTVGTTVVKGQVMKMFEGENVVDYQFDIPETATTSVERDGALIKVIDQDYPLAEVYFSFEGGRGYTPQDYINQVIAKSVSVVNTQGTSTVGLNDWMVVESARSTWHIASVANGNWLVVIENRKVDEEKVAPLIESFSAK